MADASEPPTTPARRGQDRPTPPPTWIRTFIHDLRNPLQRISMAAELLDVDGLGRRLVDKIERATSDMETLIDDIQLLSNLEGGNIQFSPSGCPPVRLVAMAVEQLEQRGVEAKIDIDLAPTIPSVLVDPARTAEALRLLLASAIAASPSSTDVRVRSLEGDSTVGISIFEKGRSFSAEDCEEMSATEPTTPEGKPAGGLRLLLAKRLLLGQGIAFKVRPVEAGNEYSLVFPVDEGAGA